MLSALVPAKLLVLVVGVAVAAIAWRSSSGVRSPKWMLPAATLTAALIFALVTNGAHVLVLSRHTTSLYVPSVLSLFAVIANARGPVTVLVRTWTAIAMVAATIALVVTYRPLAKPGDWIRVSRFVQERERAGEPIAVFEAENALPFAHYYRGPNAVVPVPAGVDFRRYDLSAFIVRTPSELVRTFPSKQQRVWLLRSGDCQADGVSYGCNIVDAYVHGRYRTLISRDFYDAHVLLLEKIDKRPTS